MIAPQDRRERQPTGGKMNPAADISGDDHVLGNRDAEVIVIQYGDYQCPYTARAHDVLTGLRDQLGDRLCLVYRHLPLSHLHPAAELAAEAAEGAAAQGKFWEMHAAIFENQAQLSVATLTLLADDLDLDGERLSDDLAERRHRARVQADARQAAQLGAHQTPTFFINGERHNGDSDQASLEAAIANAMQ
jgi:protein-disulfide isomerase